MTLRRIDTVISHGFPVPDDCPEVAETSAITPPMSVEAAKRNAEVRKTLKKRIFGQTGFYFSDADANVPTRRTT